VAKLSIIQEARNTGVHEWILLTQKLMRFANKCHICKTNIALVCTVLLVNIKPAKGVCDVVTLECADYYLKAILLGNMYGPCWLGLA
jgi:hypothetical protein